MLGQYVSFPGANVADGVAGGGLDPFAPRPYRLGFSLPPGLQFGFRVSLAEVVERSAHTFAPASQATQ
jgi:hypothetical protein